MEEHDRTGKIEAIWINPGENRLTEITPDDKEQSEYLKRLEKIRRQYPKAYLPWSSQDEKLLFDLYLDGEKVELIAESLGRQPGAIRSRLRKLMIEK